MASSTSPTNPNDAKDLRYRRQAPSASVAHQLPNTADTDPELTRVVTAWPDLPAPIKAAVLALIGAAR